MFDVRAFGKIDVDVTGKVSLKVSHYQSLFIAFAINVIKISAG